MRSIRRDLCHADSGLRPRWRSSSQGDEENQLQGVPVPFLLLKQWGRIGTDGCKIAHRYDTEALAICDGRLRLRPGAGMLKRSEEIPAA